MPMDESEISSTSEKRQRERSGVEQKRNERRSWRILAFQPARKQYDPHSDSRPKKNPEYCAEENCGLNFDDIHCGQPSRSPCSLSVPEFSAFTAIAAASALTRIPHAPMRTANTRATSVLGAKSP